MVFVAVFPAKFVTSRINSRPTVSLCDHEGAQDGGEAREAARLVYGEVGRVRDGVLHVGEGAEVVRQAAALFQVLGVGIEEIG